MLSSNSLLQVFFGSFWHDTGSESLTPLERAAYNQLGCQVRERHVTEKLSKMQDAKSRSFTTESLNIWETFAEINNNVSVFYTHGLIATVIVNAHGNCLDGREGLELCSAPFSPQSFFLSCHFNLKTHHYFTFIFLYESLEIHGGPPVPQRLPPEERKSELPIGCVSQSVCNLVNLSMRAGGFHYIYKSKRPWQNWHVGQETPLKLFPNSFP